MVTEALRRRRVTADPSDRFVERLFGLELTQAHYERGAAFVDGVVERAGADALERLWTSERELPTPAEIDAPGLWLARIDLRPSSESDVDDVGADDGGRSAASSTPIVLRGRHPPLGRRAGIEQQLTVDAALVRGQVAVPEHDDAGVGEPSSSPAASSGTGAAVVDHRDAHTVEVDYARVNGSTPVEPEVVVAEHCVHRRVRGELVEKLLRETSPACSTTSASPRRRTRPRAGDGSHRRARACRTARRRASGGRRPRRRDRHAGLARRGPGGSSRPPVGIRSPNPAAKATTTKPSCAGMGTITGRKPPITHSNWNLVSNPAKDRPKFASGASRCTMASNARRPVLAPTPTVSASAAEPIRPPCDAHPVEITPTASSADTRMRSSETTCLRRGAISAPSNAPATLATSTAPKYHAGDVAGWPVPIVGEAGRVTHCPADRQPHRDRGVVAPTLQVEREQEGEEADDAAQQPHRLCRVHDASAP